MIHLAAGFAFELPDWFMGGLLACFALNVTFEASRFLWEIRMRRRLRAKENAAAQKRLP